MLNRALAMGTENRSDKNILQFQAVYGYKDVLIDNDHKVESHMWHPCAEQTAF